MNKLEIFIGNVVNLIIQPLITLLFALALAFFLWGLAMFVLNAGDPDGRKKGRDALIWGIVGLFIMTGVMGILAAVTGTFEVGFPPRNFSV